MSKIFIIGGAGFIGSYMARKLVGLGDEVVIFDAFLNFVDPFKSNYQKSLNMRFDGFEDKVEIVRGDIRHKGHLLRTLREQKPETVVHLAALPIATKSNQFPEDAIEINLLGLSNVLESLREMQSVERFVFTSSSFIYGDFKYEPADENHPTNPIDVYGATKKCGEILTKGYSTKFGINHTIIRPSAVYGPGDSNRRVSQVFIENAMQGKPLTLFNGGMEKVDFTYVSDTAEGFVRAIKSDKAVNETFNITRGQGRTVKEFAEILANYFPDVEVVEKPTDMRRPKRGSLSVEKARKLTGFEPKHSLEEGIPKYIEGLKENKVVL